jgi:hypothetical protein
MILLLNLLYKDVRRLWPQALVCLIVIALRLYNDPAYTPYNASRHNPFREEWFILLAFIALGVLIASLIHQEKLIGNQQYWLTRPLDWRQIFLAKALFILIFVILPLFLGQLAVLAWLGFPSSQYFLILLMKDIVFIAIWILPAVALASITRNLVQMATAILIGIVLFSYFLNSIPSIQISNWGELEWIRSSIILTIAILGSSLVLLFQYRTRRTVLARGFAGVAIAAILCALILQPDAWAFSIQTLFSKRPMDQTAVQILHHDSSQIWRAIYPSDPVASALRIRVDITNLPPVFKVKGMAAQYTVKAASGEWRAGWRIIKDETEGTPEERWISLPIDPEFLRSINSAPLQIIGDMDLTVLEIKPLNAKFNYLGKRVYVSGTGACDIHSNFHSYYNCLSPWPRAHIDLEASSIALASSDECSPWPTTASFSAVRSNNPAQFRIMKLLHTQQDFKTTQLIVARPVAFIRRHFEFSNLSPAN